MATAAHSSESNSSTFTNLSIPVSEPSKEWSYGLIPIRFLPTADAPSIGAKNPRPSTKSTEVFIIEQIPHPRTNHKPYWGFPKGHPEKGDEDSVATAIREVREETGLDVKRKDILGVDDQGAEAEVLPPLIERYRNPLKGHIKEVRYWLALLPYETTSDFKSQPAEIGDAGWYSWEEATARFALEGGKIRNVLKRAREALDGIE